ncbi:MAG: alpha/beta hydrolase [Clostridia bacterium]|nr:alpha/beta hydrolase [Clostridia bacterium]
MKITFPALSLFYKYVYRVNDRRVRNAPPWDRYSPLLDEPYGEGESKVFDLFYAPPEKRKKILLILVHGGYYIRGRHRDSYPFAVSFLEEGFDVASVEYRVGGKGVGTREKIGDVAEFLRFLFSSLGKLGLDGEEKFFISGDSAGGHLALINAEGACDPGIGIDLGGVRLDGALLNCPSYDYAAYREQKELSRGMKKRMLGKDYREKGSLERVSPRTYIASLSVPVFVSTCKNDFLREGVLRLYGDLDRFGKKYVRVDIDEDDKKVAHVHNVIYPDLPASVKVNRAMMDFMTQ